jgi:hypothetical protein
MSAQQMILLDLPKGDFKIPFKVTCKTCKSSFSLLSPQFHKAGMIISTLVDVKMADLHIYCYCMKIHESYK